MIDTWIFDLDGTLYDYDRCNSEGEKALYLEMDRLWGIKPEQSRILLRSAKEKVKQRLGQVAASHNRMLYMQNITEQLRVKTGSYAPVLYDAYWNTFLDSMTMFSGMKMLLENLKEQKKQLVLLTDMTVMIQFRKLKRLGLEDTFDYIVTSEEAGEEKPSERMFQLVLEKTGRKKEEMIMIGDDQKKDVDGAERFGIRGIRFCDTSSFYDEVRKWQ